MMNTEDKAKVVPMDQYCGNKGNSARKVGINKNLLFVPIMISIRDTVLVLEYEHTLYERVQHTIVC